MANQKMAEAAIYEVVEILNWKDCDFEGRTFKLNDRSTWYAVGGTTPLYSLVLGQTVVIIPMSDVEIAKYRRGIFPSRPYWIILHPQENALTIKIAHKMR